MSFTRLCIALFLISLAACQKLGMGNTADGPDGAPTEQELKKIAYMSSANSGPQGRKLYDHLEEAKTCADYELAMRWNRPPNVEGGLFHKKLNYLTSGVPADLPKESEVLIRARIEKTDTMTAGGFVWILSMPDGTRIQAAETADFLQKQDQVALDNKKYTALVKPNKVGRAFCGQGIYQGMLGKAADSDAKIALLSMLFAMDRDK
jgi:hypothetical protein